MERIDGGWRVKTVDRYHVDVLHMAFNYRLVTTPVDAAFVYDRFWCYSGTSIQAFVNVVLAARAWDGADDTEPVGWNKNGQTEEWREPDWSTIENADHEAVVEIMLNLMEGVKG